MCAVGTEETMDVVKLPVRSEYIRLVQDRERTDREPAAIVRFKPKPARKPDTKNHDWLEIAD